jgi:hypothetical protein
MQKAAACAEAFVLAGESVNSPFVIHTGDDVTLVAVIAPVAITGRQVILVENVLRVHRH